MTVTTPSENVTQYIDSLRQRRQTDANETAEPSRSDAEPVEQTADCVESTAGDVSTVFGLIELLLKDQPRLNGLARTADVQRELIPRLLWIGLGGYAIFAAVLAVVFGCAQVWPELTPIALWLDDPEAKLIRFVPAAEGVIWRCWIDGSALHLTAAYACGLIGAIGVCLPSFYFYGLLAGVRTSMLQVTTHALIGLASGAVALLGALPIYLAVMLGLVIFEFSPGAVQAAGLFGLALPFVTGLYGTRALSIGFLALSDTMPEERRCRRRCFLRRLLVAWSGCYTAVTPVMIFALWEYLAR
jgi:hypothetical protein